MADIIFILYVLFVVAIIIVSYVPAARNWFFPFYWKANYTLNNLFERE